MELTFLVDYHNVHMILSGMHPVASRRGRFTQDVVDWVVDTLCARLENWRARASRASSDCRVRFYSGWFVEEAFSDQASMVRSAITRQRTLFPGRVRYRYDLATSLVDLPQERIAHTVRPRGLPSLRWALPVPNCQHAHACGIDGLAKSWDHDCCVVPNCPERPSRFVASFEQKTVDTHIVCDAISLATMGVVVLVSNDTDFVPAMMLCAHRSKFEVLWMRLPRSGQPLPAGPYGEAALARQRVQFHDLM